MLKPLINGNCLFQGYSGIPNDLRSLILFLAEEKGLDVGLLASTKQALAIKPTNIQKIHGQLEHLRSNFSPSRIDKLWMRLSLVQYLFKKHKISLLHSELRDVWFENMLGDFLHSTQSIPQLKFYISTYLHRYQEIYCNQIDTTTFSHYLSYNFENVAVSKNTKHICRVHDLVPLFLPHTVNNAPRIHNKYVKLLKKYKSCETTFLANSKQTINELIKMKIDEDRIKLFYCRPNRLFTQSTATDYSNKDSMIWCSTVEPRKNIECLLEACEILCMSNCTDLPEIVIVGATGWNYKQNTITSFEDRIKKLNKKIKIQWYKNVSSSLLLKLYEKSLAFISTSIAEGFNISSVEAAYCGNKLILSDLPVHKEIHGDNALYFKHNDSKKLASLILEVSKNSYKNSPSYLNELYTKNNELFL